MDNVELVEILDSGDDLLDKLGRLALSDSLGFDDVIKKLTPRSKLHNEKELIFILDYLIRKVLRKVE